jgi:hypothetical protein
MNSEQNQHFEDHFCPHPQGCDVVGNNDNKHGARTGIQMTDWIPSHVWMRTEIVHETLVCSPYNPADNPREFHCNYEQISPVSRLHKSATQILVY